MGIENAVMLLTDADGEILHLRWDEAKAYLRWTDSALSALENDEASTDWISQNARETRIMDARRGAFVDFTNHGPAGWDFIEAFASETPYADAGDWLMEKFREIADDAEMDDEYAFGADADDADDEYAFGADADDAEMDDIAA